FKTPATSAARQSPAALTRLLRGGYDARRPELRRRAGAASPGIRPVGNLLRAVWDERAPRLGADRSFRLPHDAELAVALDLADHHRLPQVVVLGVHLHVESRRRLHVLEADRLTNGGDVGCVR